MISCLSAAVIEPANTQAQSEIDPNVEFVEFWSNYESIFLFHPYLVKQVFLGIVDLKGNRRVALKYVDKEILSCNSSARALSECRMDQLKLERQKRKTSRYQSVPVNVISVTGRPFKKNKKKYVLTIEWQPLMVKPPVMSIDEFYSYLGVANESKYYSGKRYLDRIQINPLFENRVTVVTSRARARNIMHLYRNPPKDLKDTFIFRVDTASMKPNGATANFDLHLKAVKVRINHLTFRTTTELLQ